MSNVSQSAPGEPPSRGAGDPFAGELAAALRPAARGEFGRCRITLTDVSEVSGRPSAERAICQALLALTALALGEDAEARVLCRRAMGGARRRESDGPRQGRCRRVALALVACARDIAGGRDPAGGQNLVSLPGLLREYAAFVAHVSAHRACKSPPGALTPAESEVLGLVAAGRNATQIAAVLGRSAHTVRTHLRNISDRLDTHGRHATLARARELGFLETEKTSR